MKQLFNILVLVLIANIAIAQAPQGIPYQAAARNSSGAILASTNISVRFTIRDSIATGTIKYRETHSVTTTAQGMFSLNVGQGTVVSGTFAGINWGVNSKFMQMEMDPAGGSSYIDMGTSQMMSVPYAMCAGTLSTINSDGATTTFVGISLVTQTPSFDSAGIFLSGGNIISDGGLPIKCKGICWNTSPHPTTDLLTKIIDSNGNLGYFSAQIHSFLANTTYYVRAFIVNDSGTFWGNEVVVTIPVKVGVSYQGGYIAYIFQPGDSLYISGEIHGLIAAPNDQNSGIEWATTYGNVSGARYYSIGAGVTNTNAIVSMMGSTGKAAKLCYDLVLNGYNDWFLPSRNELVKLFENKNLIGGFVADKYWSSSETSTTAANTTNFSTGLTSVDLKGSLIRVRAIRIF
jgi:hypothetical protein